MFPFKGYTGRYLEISLEDGQSRQAALPKYLAEKYIGGRGFGARLLWEYLAGATRDRDESPLFMITGPLTGITPSSSRLSICSYSPLTGLYGFSSAGGGWACELKRAGWDYVVITGKAAQPVFITITEDRVDVEDAGWLWGLDTRATGRAIKKRKKDHRMKILSIGQAGENLSRIASVMVDDDHAAARSGMGCVMGRKNLKAVAVRGRSKIALFDPKSFKKSEKELILHMKGDHVSSVLAPRFGTTMWLSFVNEVYGGLGTRNFQTGFYKDANRISGEELDRQGLSRGVSCRTCFLRCDRQSKVTSGDYKGAYVGSGPEYATLQNMGSRLANNRLDIIIRANELCNLYGLDTYSTGGVIGFAFELYEKRIINERDTGGMKLTWGDPEVILELITQIAFKRGFGKTLGDGTSIASERIGSGAKDYAIETKGLDYPSIDPRASKAYGLACIISPRGADHCYAMPSTSYFTKEQAKEMFGTSEAVNPFSFHGKGKMVKFFEEGMAIVDMAGVCKLAYELYCENVEEICYRRLQAIPELIRHATGMRVSSDSIVECADRVCNLEKLINILLKGTGRSADSAAPRFISEPMPVGPAKGNIFEQDALLDQYYEAKGWVKETGFPSGYKLKDLGLESEMHFLQNLGHEFRNRG